MVKKKQHIVLLLFSMFIVGVMIAHDYKYDYNPYPMTAADYVMEITICGTVYTAIIYGLLYAFYQAFRAWVTGKQ